MSDTRAPADRSWNTVSRAMAEIRVLQGVSSVLAWDQETYMPPGGAAARGDALAAVDGAVHDRLAAPGLGEALARLEADPPEEPDRAAAVRELGRDVARAT